MNGITVHVSHPVDTAGNSSRGLGGLLTVNGLAPVDAAAPSPSRRRSIREPSPSLLRQTEATR